MTAAQGFSGVVRLDRCDAPDGVRLSGIAARDGDVQLAGVIRLVERAALADRLGVARDTDDAALVLAAWRRWGRDCPRHLTGDFAFVIWDAAERTLFGACDPLGIKPLFHDRHGDLMVVSDTLDGLLAVHPDPPGIDPVEVGRWVSKPFAYTGHASLRARVALLRPGHRFVAMPGRFAGDAYHDLNDAPDVRFASRAAYIEAFREQFLRAVADAFGPDDALGVHLSGGLDSSSIAAVAARMRDPGARPLAYCWQPVVADPRAQTRDQQLVRLLAAREALELTPVSMDADDACAHLALDPAVHSVTSTLMLEAPVQRLAQARGVRVFLSGWGGDECVTSQGHGPRGLIDRVRYHFLNTTPPPPPDSGPSHYRGPDLPAPEPDVPWNGDSLRARRISRLSGWGLAERMASWHWAGRRHGIDYRYPMLDIRLVRFALGLPPELYRPGPRGRDMARAMLAPFLPREIATFTDKSDTNRSAANKLALVEAMRRLLPRLDRADPERAAMIDVATLRADIERLIATGDGPTGLILRAVAFLKLD